MVKKRLSNSGRSGCSRDPWSNTPVRHSRSLRVAIEDGDIQAGDKSSGGRHFELEHKDEYPEDDGCCSGFELELEDNDELRENGLGDDVLGENGLGKEDEQLVDETCGG